MVRCAKGVSTNADVVLKFYVDMELYAKALSTYESLNKSDFICKSVRTFAKCLKT